MTGRRVLYLTGIGHASSHAWELIFPAVAVPMARELGIPFTETVKLGFLLYLAYGLGAPFAGFFTDRIGARRVLILCLVGGGLSGLLVARASGPLTQQLALFALGLFGSLYHPAGLALLSVHFEGRMGRAFAINGIAGNVGIAATPLLSGLFASLFGWRSAFVLFSLPALIIGVVFLFLTFEDRPTKATAAVKNERVEPYPLLLLAVAVTAGGLAYRLHTLVVPALLRERIPELAGLRLEALAHVDNLAATGLTTIAYAMGVFGQWIAGRIADTRPLVSSYLVFHCVSVPLIAFAAYASGVPLVLALFAYLFFSIGMQPIENSLLAKLVPPTWRGRAYAGKFILSFGVGATGAYVVGWVAPLGGLGASLGVATLLELILIASAAALLAHERRLTTSRPATSSST